MNESFYTYENLSTRSGFNSALNHFQSISGIIDDFEEYTNLADILNRMLDEKKIQQNQILPTVYALLKDKYAYSFNSFNLKISIEEFSALYESVKNWKAVDIVILYHHPDLGPLIINPKNKKHLDSLNLLKSNELITIYAGTFSDTDKNNIGKKALNAVLKFFEGSKISKIDTFIKGKYKITEEKVETTVKKASVRKKYTTRKTRKAEPEVVQETVNTVQKSSGGSAAAGRMTPFYSVPVTNELFHNGNVEAWKKIIQSYNARHPGLEVYIYYDGERIHDIHSLFKWGKVKHGSTILFAVKGENIKDVAKLQRYLRQGASPMFEAFLKFPVNKILNLF